jgi:branched-chain amino acid transport system substrate-binding protein
VHDVYLARVKKASEVKEPWDYEKILKTIPASEAFRPASDSGCSLS